MSFGKTRAPRVQVQHWFSFSSLLNRGMLRIRVQMLCVRRECYVNHVECYVNQETSAVFFR